MLTPWIVRFPVISTLPSKRLASLPPFPNTPIPALGSSAIPTTPRPLYHTPAALSASPDTDTISGIINNTNHTAAALSASPDADTISGLAHNSYHGTTSVRIAPNTGTPSADAYHTASLISFAPDTRSAFCCIGPRYC